VYALSLRLTADQNLAEAYTKKVFVEAWKNLSSIREDVSFASWLTGFTVFYFLSEWHANRIQSKTNKESISWLFDYKLDVLIACLPVEERVAVILHDMKKYSMEETADLLGIGLENTKTVLNNARRKLILSV
jgi:RNA polymerase sigma-70 factor (ECF subfamily)